MSDRIRSWPMHARNGLMSGLLNVSPLVGQVLLLGLGGHGHEILRSASASAVKMRCTISWISGGSFFQAATLKAVWKPDQTWLVRLQYFCTSYSLAVSISTSGFSCPSTMPVCNAL